MKQIVIINDELKMSKGKIARVCLYLGMGTKQLLNIFNKIKWINNNQRAIILKSDVGIDLIKLRLVAENINYVQHIDAGYTQVPKQSCCGIMFFVKKDCELFKEMKLL